jgi:hypothetical protein
MQITPELIDSTAGEVVLYFQQFNNKLTIDIYKQLAFNVKVNLYKAYKLNNMSENNFVIKWVISKSLDLIMLPYVK